jgi:hypothetical protein
MLISGGVYAHQTVKVNGTNTGGDPDLFKLFAERFHQLLRREGRAGVLLPSSLCSGEGATGLRQMLFLECQVEALYSFENWGKRFFQIHASFKFLTIVFEKRTPSGNQFFPAAFMLRDESFLALPEPQREARSVRITSDFIRLTNPSYLSLIDLRDDKELKLVERIYREVPSLATKLNGEGTWNAEFHTELALTHEAWRLLRREWAIEHGCEPSGSSFIAPTSDWYEVRSDAFVAGSRWIVPDGTKYRIQCYPPPGTIETCSQSRQSVGLYHRLRAA